MLNLVSTCFHLTPRENPTLPRVTAVILAAGKGTRMQSDLPKVLFPVLGRPMLHWVLDAMQQAGVDRKIVVVGYRDDLVRAEVGGRSGLSFALQAEQLGTGHAVSVCREALAEGLHPEDQTIVVAGDSPLIQADSLKDLMQHFAKSQLDCLLGTLCKDRPQGLGRIVRSDSGEFERIVEEKDASPQEKEIREVNMSTYLFRTEALLWALSQLKNHNAQGEYYLTDCPQLLKQAGRKVDALPVLRACEALSINTIQELGQVETKMQEMGYRCAN